MTADMILAENDVTSRILSILLCRMMSEEAKPYEWELASSVGETAKKKGDLTNCNFYRRVTLMTVVMKIYSMLNLQRLERKIDEKKRDEQVEFRKVISCTD
ncbi:uncharacterized protein [Palaemon carinicauda]|uniref:uncharacterized protein n=1 Tax=Palaemon carinicauda TaxID=392227 RepID=UPI0035B62BD8